MILASNLGDPTLPTRGYLLSLWAALFVLTVLAVANLIVLGVVLRRQRPPRPAPAQPIWDLPQKPG